ncbi:hypothetical protein E3N88_41101 [Mikania micrantha]|uniref:Uncharacterized protein n=1 Tax=Mikania micrantha TaxID=192012 RepID=A0A5N6LPM1_9ASTR|nr:hypothetical protein E3N88_41101 [Mikania micrantha]
MVVEIPLSSTRTLPINRSALGNVTDFGWKLICSQVLEADFENIKGRDFNRSNGRGNARGSTGVLTYLQVLKSWLRSSVKNIRNDYHNASAGQINGYGALCRHKPTVTLGSSGCVMMMIRMFM